MNFVLCGWHVVNSALLSWMKNEYPRKSGESKFWRSKTSHWAVSWGNEFFPLQTQRVNVKEMRTATIVCAPNFTFTYVTNGSVIAWISQVRKGIILNKLPLPVQFECPPEPLQENKRFEHLGSYNLCQIRSALLL